MGLRTVLEPAHALRALKRAFPGEGFTARPLASGEHELTSDNPARTDAEVEAALTTGAGHLTWSEGAPARAERDRLLAASDWTQLPDAPLADDLRAAWRAYRQALRDVPAQAGFPLSIEWPEPPIPPES